MGLDMYLNAKKYLFSDDRKNLKIEGIKDIPKGADIKYLIAEVGYWRKANAIHGWFVKHVQEGEDDCKEYFVDLDKLKELATTCADVLKRWDAIKKKWKRGGLKFAQENLPSQSGFFFGGTDYDEYYIRDLEQTILIIENLSKYSDSWDFYYQSSW